MSANLIPVPRFASLTTARDVVLATALHCGWARVDNEYGETITGPAPSEGNFSIRRGAQWLKVGIEGTSVIWVADMVAQDWTGPSSGKREWLLRVVRTPLDSARQDDGECERCGLYAPCERHAFTY